MAQTGHHTVVDYHRMRIFLNSFLYQKKKVSKAKNFSYTTIWLVNVMKKLRLHLKWQAIVKRRAMSSYICTISVQSCTRITFT